MCGVYGYFGKIKKGKGMLVLKLMTALGEQTEIRGRHSTGYFARNKKFEYMEKQAIPATEFYIEAEMIREAIVDSKSFCFLGHNRQASKGAVNSINAHPFVGENIVLIHNGTVAKMKDIMSEKASEKMVGDTDSEAIMWHFDEVGVTDTKSWKRLANYSCVIYDRNVNKVYFARDYEKPLVILDLRNILGIRVFASTIEIAAKALRLAGIDTEKEKINFFNTKPYCLYEADPMDGEVTNLGFYGPKQPEKVTVKTEATYDTKAIREAEAYNKEMLKKMGIKPYQDRFFDKKREHKLRKHPDNINKAMIVYGD
jgi:hypothetical protein